MLQPAFSAVLVGLQAPAQAIADSRHRLDYFLRGRTGPATAAASGR
jgi:hypothetical protein